ncbi:MAG: 3-hydroxybutyryl-CoA dehydrogenase [Streptosporangiales bacterium]|nr:3-hydroxybutyryl-CoA dehydrogenase [Streptosporangiales bacterium]
MSSADIQIVGVVGLGTMGAGIAEVFAKAGLTVIGIEIDDAALERGRGHLESSVGRAVKRGRMTEEERDALLARVTLGTDRGALAEADLVVEAVPERLDLKRDVFTDLDRVSRPGVVLATNTSSLSVTEIAALTSRPERVVGMHFFNPAPVMRLVEVVGTVLTEPEVTAAVAALAERIGKTPVTVGDRAGFVANALLVPYLNHAVRLYETGIATRDDIDTTMTAGAGLPMGPLTLLDLVGLDVALAIMDVLWEEFRDPRYAAAPLLRRMVTAGLLGRKTGRGFYTYPAQPAAAGEVPAARAALPGRVAVIGDDTAVLSTACRATGVDVYVPAEVESAEVDPERVDAELLACDLVITEWPPGLEPVAGDARKVVGMRVSEDRLVEVVTSAVTAPGVLAHARALAARVGPPVVVGRTDFLLETLLSVHLADAVRMVQDGYATPADIDTAMRLGCGYPSGPVQLLDEIGLEDVCGALSLLHTRHAESCYAPPALLTELVAVGADGLSDVVPGR